MKQRTPWPGILASLLVACAPPPSAAPAGNEPSVYQGSQTLRVDPAQVSSFGYVRVHLEADGLTLGALDDLSVVVGGIHGIDLAADDTGAGLWVTLQGSPVPGPTDVTLRWSGGQRTFPGAVRYLPPRTPGLTRWMAIGASWTQGIQRGGLDATTQLRGPAAQLARAAAAFLPLPLIRDWVLPPADLSVVHNCEVPTLDFDPDVEALFEQLTDETSGDLVLARARIDPGLVAQNVAVGGYELGDLLESPTNVLVFLANVVSNPAATGTEMLVAPARTQIDLVEALRPDLVVSFDLFANDVGQAVFDDLSVASFVPLDRFESQIEEVLRRVGRSATQAFVANMPKVDLLPYVEQLRRSALARGEAPGAFQGRLDAVNQRIRAMNRLLQAAADRHDNVHVVDLARRVDQLAAEGLQVAGQRLGTGIFGGLMGLDGVHATDTGYAMFANLFVDAINERLGATIRRIDLAEVLASDPESPAVMASDPRLAPCRTAATRP